ncbi:MAG: penicillin-binding protein activator [Burkholderiales bacterium]|nr:MAG: penicillin-binding protein activator [Burkholderiales bacterium]
MRRVLLLLGLLAATLSAAAQPIANPPAETLPAIVLLLPGPTTPFARAAEAVRAGFFAAHAAAGAPMAIAARETDETPVAVVAAIEAAASRDARMIVGPLSRDAVDALARSGGARLPVLALNTPSGDAALPTSMLALGLRVEDEARGIVRALVRGPLATGLSGVSMPFAVITGGGGLERRAAAAFIAAAREYGRVAEAFELSIKQDRLADLSKRLAAQPWRAILLALDAGEAAAVRPWLPPETIVVGTSRIHLLEESNLGLAQELEGIAFVDMPWLVEPDHPAVMVYPRAAIPYSAELERLYALGIDAYRIAAERLKGSQRFELDGVTGRLRVDPGLGGRVERLPSLAVFVDGKAERRDVLR